MRMLLCNASRVADHVAQDSGPSSCHDFAALRSLVSQLTIAPFSGAGCPAIKRRLFENWTTEKPRITAALLPFLTAPKLPAISGPPYTAP